MLKIDLSRAFRVDETSANLDKKGVLRFVTLNENLAELLKHEFGGRVYFVNQDWQVPHYKWVLRGSKAMFFVNLYCDKN